uniref:Small integral membrane protein 19 n=3 Tax=Mustelinae TaxID=169418 RepID=A0A8C7AMN4_NEOVI
MRAIHRGSRAGDRGRCRRARMCSDRAGFRSLRAAKRQSRPGSSGGGRGRFLGGDSTLSPRGWISLREERVSQSRGRDWRGSGLGVSPMPAGYGVMGDDGSMDYSVHEAWNEATNVYLVVILVSFVLFMYAKRNKRKIMRIFSVPPTAETLSEPSFYDTMSKIRLRQQLEMYSISRKYDYQQPQNQADSVQLSLE